MSVAPPKWRRARSWREVRQKFLRIAGIRVRMAKPNAFLHKAPHKLSAIPAAAFSAQGELENVSYWRPATLLAAGRKSISVELADGGHLTVEGLDGFEILLDDAAPKKEEDEESEGEET